MKMKKKALLLGVLCLLVLGMLTACSTGGNEAEIEEDSKPSIQESTPPTSNDAESTPLADNDAESAPPSGNDAASVPSSGDYTQLEIFGAAIQFKLADPTSYWNCCDNFGAGEIDTVFIISPDGTPVDDYYDQIHTSGIIFKTSEDGIDSEKSLKSAYKQWDGIDVQIENIENGIFSRHLLGESSDLYFESYCMEYEADFDGELSTIAYAVELRIYKGDYTPEEIAKAIAEYHLIIETLEFVK